MNAGRGEGASRAIRFADPDTSWNDDAYTQVPVPSRRFRRSLPDAHLRRLIGVWSSCAVAVPCALLLWAASTPGPDVAPLMVGVGGLLLTGIVWCAAAVVWSIRRMSGRVNGPPVALMLVALAVAGTLLLSLTTIPLRARFQFGRSAFDEFAAEALEAVGEHRGLPLQQTERGSAEWEALHPEVPRRLGGYPVDTAWVAPDGVHIVVSGAGSGGFAFLPDGPDVNSSSSHRYVALGDGWYLFVADF
jgi:hypothetical protein